MIPYHRPLTLSEHEMDTLTNAIKIILRSGQLTNGIYVRELERKIKERYNVSHCIATTNATLGLMICLEYKDYEYEPLQTTSFNWWSDKYVAEFLKRYIWYDDIDIDTWLPIEKYTCPSLYLNTFGSIGKSKRKDTIFDSTHCLGAKITDIGLAHVFSLAATKLITSCEGGLIITNNDEFAEWAREKRDRMCRMSEVHALIGLTMLQHIDEIMKWKRMVHTYYKRNIPGQFQRIDNNSNYNTIGFLNTEHLIIPQEIETRQYYEPLQKGLENTDYVYENIICLASFVGVDYKKIVYLIREANE